jgi:hypothetical protein
VLRENKHTEPYGLWLQAVVPGTVVPAMRCKPA